MGTYSYLSELFNELESRLNSEMNSAVIVSNSPEINLVISAKEKTVSITMDDIDFDLEVWYFVDDIIRRHFQ